MGKPTSSTLVSLAGLFKEKDERTISQVPDGQSRGDERTGEPIEHPDKEVTLHRVRVSLFRTLRLKIHYYKYSSR